MDTTGFRFLIEFAKALDSSDSETLFESFVDEFLSPANIKWGGGMSPFEINGYLDCSTSDLSIQTIKKELKKYFESRYDVSNIEIE